MDTLDQYVTTVPNPQNALDIFKGEWSSHLPPHLSEYEAGDVLLFQDARIDWAAEQLGGFKDKTVLELGPLEAGHTYMLENYGAAAITAIEANTRAYLKCLVIKEILGLSRSHFLCGDFIEFLRQTEERFDVCVASGVLYHMRNPAELIGLIAKTSNQVLIWTHYYDAEAIRANTAIASKFPESMPSEYEGFQHTLYRYEYQAALDWQGFCGGTAPYSHWLSREDILKCCQHFGFHRIEVNFETLEHPNGPSLALVAQKQSDRSEVKLQKLQNRVNRMKTQIKQLEKELATKQQQITAMETSKFWLLRQRWFQLKRSLGLPTQE
jgi:hypothetical protein